MERAKHFPKAQYFGLMTEMEESVFHFLHLSNPFRGWQEWWRLSQHALEDAFDKLAVQ